MAIGLELSWATKALSGLLILTTQPPWLQQLLLIILCKFSSINLLLRKLWDAVSGEEKFNFPHNKIVKTTHFNAVKLK
jgi:hypothetical protein